MRITARKLLIHSPDYLFQKLKGDFTLVFDDGVEIQTNEMETVYSSIVWEFHRRYPKTPLLSTHHLRGMLGKSEPAADIHRRLLTNVLWSAFDANNQNKDLQDLLDDLGLLVFQTTNEIYNFIVTKLERWVTSLDITDFVAFTKDPEICAFLETAPANEAGINAVAAFLKKAIYENPKFKRNPLAIAYRAGICRQEQALQCIGWRGALTDLDSNIFEHPITTGYVQGIRSLHDSMIESRSGGKSLLNTDKPLKTAEYFSRRQQLACFYLRNLHIGDCGSDRYIDWLVKPKRSGDGGNACDLDTICGSYYLDEESNSLKVVRQTDAHLIGKTIKLRSIVAGCKHPDPYGVCLTCVGEVGLANSKDSNFGQTTGVSMMAKIGQLIMSTKHFDGSSAVEGISLSVWQKNFLEATEDGSSYRFSKKLKGKDVCIRVRTDNAPGLSNLKRERNVKNLNLSNTSSFEIMAFDVKVGQSLESHSVEVRVNDRWASFTLEFLEHIKYHGFVVENEKYVIDLKDWDFDKPAMVLPLSHYNMSNHQKAIAKMLERTKDSVNEKTDFVAPEDRIIQFHDLVNKRLSINLSVLSVVLYCSMIVDSKSGDYSLPKAWTDRNPGALREVLMNRSIATQMGYQSHRQAFFTPVSYLRTNRMDSVYDGMIMPEILNDPNLNYSFR
jgi:hypothetical protein